MKLRLVLVSLAISIVLTVPAFADITIFDDGATNGQYNAFFIDGPNPGPFNQSISDGFVASTSGFAKSFDAGLWVLGGTTPTTLSWWLGTSAFAGDLGTGNVAQVNYTYVGSNGYGYDVYNVHIDGLGGAQLTAGNTYWLSLGNGNDNFGTQYVGWDVVPGPATCNFMQGGVNYGDCGDGGEAFTLYGDPIPEPGTLAMLGGGILAAAGALRRKIGF